MNQIKLAQVRKMSMELAVHFGSQIMINRLTIPDSFPLPRIEDCVDRIGQSWYILKIDLLKSYWQVPLTDRAKEMGAFVIPDGLYQHVVMTFGQRNASATVSV